MQASCTIFAFNFLIRTKYLYRRMLPGFLFSLALPGTTIRIPVPWPERRKHHGMQLKRLMMREHWLMVLPLAFIAPSPWFELAPQHSNRYGENIFGLKAMHTKNTCDAIHMTMYYMLCLQPPTYVLKRRWVPGPQLLTQWQRQPHVLLAS